MGCLPHGCYSLLIAILCITAWGASLFIGDGCDFATVSGPMVAELTTAGQRPPDYMEFGIGAYKVPGASECTVLGMDDPTDNSSSSSSSSSSTNLSSLMDNAWVTARTFAFLALAMGGGGTIFFCATLFFLFSRGTWRWTGYLLLIASFCQTLTFVWFLNGLCDWNTCLIHVGAKADIVASACWFLAGVLILMYYPSPVRFSRMQQGDGDDIPTATVLQEDHHEQPDENEDEQNKQPPIKAELV